MRVSETDTFTDAKVIHILMHAWFVISGGEYSDTFAGVVTDVMAVRCYIQNAAGDDRLRR